jgi:hypothetical protein
MEQKDPDETITVPRWKWNLFVEYIDRAAEPLFLGVEDLHNRGMLQPELRTLFLRSRYVMDYLDQRGDGQERPAENHQSGPVAKQDDPEDPERLEVQETAYRMVATYAAATKRNWCLYLSTGRTGYYGTYGGALARCANLAAPANIACLDVRSGRCP